MITNRIGHAVLKAENVMFTANGRVMQLHGMKRFW